MQAFRNLTLALLRCSLAFLRSRSEQVIVEMAPRQQLAAYSQTRSRPKLTPLDRAFWVALFRFWPRWRIFFRSSVRSGGISFSVRGVVGGPEWLSVYRTEGDHRRRGPSSSRRDTRVFGAWLRDRRPRLAGAGRAGAAYSVTTCCWPSLSYQ